MLASPAWKAWRDGAATTLSGREFHSGNDFCLYMELTLVHLVIVSLAARDATYLDGFIDH
jgi:hypothetical protein